ncbi:class I SAM-dependent methyltransferase [Cyanobacterium sp. Dongsha4]|uniref:class I SAM-dependent methyltransferase n=1 Tax=Cyanobacterium sp. DS4 TaxID=2878255 RepID=UPI002E800B86|nr:class I SAM-dependent methyltransferase [Cyanobacterium sp. Dongsha4]WVK99569.1 class I SAM-dependent methyltransferase [Cyanobacterium sp. Dongsha4]
MNNNSKTVPNVHISYNQKVRPYHLEIARLFEKYSSPSLDYDLLEIGCGFGYTLELIKNKRPDTRISAADIDPYLLTTTNKKVTLHRSIEINPMGNFEDLFDLKLTFDCIILSHVLEHTRRPYDIVRGIMKMLTPNGLAIVAVPNPVRPTIFYGNILKRHYVNRGHVYSWDRSHWINFLERICCVSVEEYSQDYVPLPWFDKFAIFKPLEISLSSFFPWLCFSNIAVIKNKE